MHRHFLETARLQSPTLTLGKDEARHLQTVLRVREGDEVELFDGRGLTALARVAAADRHGVRLEWSAPPTRHAQPACAITLFACVSKGKRMDWTVEKAVELGVRRIVPVISDRTIVRLDEADAEGKTGRWTRVAIEAARQSQAVWLPEISAPLALAATAPLLPASAPVFVAALTSDARPLRDVLAERRAGGNSSKDNELCASAPLRGKTAAGTPATAGWFVGPEGDFTPDELRLLCKHGTIPVSLGRQVLRAETAALWGLCVLGAEWL